MTYFGKKGFEHFLASGAYSDLTLVMPAQGDRPAKEYRAHKLILASNSGAFFSPAFGAPRV